MSCGENDIAHSRMAGSHLPNIMLKDDFNLASNFST